MSSLGLVVTRSNLDHRLLCAKSGRSRLRRIINIGTVVIQLSIPISVLLLCISVVGCTTPAHIVHLNMPSESERVEILVWRESSINVWGHRLVFGADERDIVQLSNGEYAHLYLPTGSHRLYVRSTLADEPYELTASLEANKKACLKTSANPLNYAKALIPFTLNFSNSFFLEPVSCLSDIEMAKYTLVPVEYGDK